LNTAVKKFIRR